MVLTDEVTFRPHTTSTSTTYLRRALQHSKDILHRSCISIAIHTSVQHRVSLARVWHLRIRGERRHGRHLPVCRRRPFPRLLVHKPGEATHLICRVVRAPGDAVDVQRTDFSVRRPHVISETKAGSIGSGCATHFCHLPEHLDVVEVIELTRRLRHIAMRREAPLHAHAFKEVVSAIVLEMGFVGVTSFRHHVRVCRGGVHGRFLRHQTWDAGRHKL